MPKDTEKALLSVAGREVAISNPNKVLFPRAGYTKLDLARYYLAVADGALRGAATVQTSWPATRMALTKSSSSRSARRPRVHHGWTS